MYNGQMVYCLIYHSRNSWVLTFNYLGGGTVSFSITAKFDITYCGQKLQVTNPVPTGDKMSFD